MKAVVFDLDGTLLNTLDDLADSVNFALESMKFPQRTIEEIRAFVGNGVKVLVHRSVPAGTNKNDEDKCLEIFKLHYLEHMYDKTRPYDGVIGLLQKLNNRGIKTAVVSNKLHTAVKALCEKYFSGLVDCAIGATNEEEKKPSPVNVKKALSVLNVDKAEAIYLGDSEVDIQTAKNAEIKFIAVTWGFRTKQQLIQAGAQTLIDSPEKLNL